MRLAQIREREETCLNTRKRGRVCLKIREKGGESVSILVPVSAGPSGVERSAARELAARLLVGVATLPLVGTEAGLALLLPALVFGICVGFAH